MKFRSILLFVLLTIPFFAYSQFQIDGEASASYNGKMIYLYAHSNDIRDKPMLKDSTVVRKRSFSFSGNMSEPVSRASLGIKNGKKMRMVGLFLEKGINRVIVTAEEGPQVFRLKMPGSEAFPLIDKLHAVEREAFSRYRRNHIVRGDLRLPEAEQREAHLEMLEVLKAHPANYASLLMLYESSQYGSLLNEEEQILATLNSFDPEIKSSELAAELRAKTEHSLHIRKRTQPSNKVSVFEVKTMQGTKFSNADLAGSPYIIAFSASWSPDALKFLPALQAVYDRHKGADLKVVYFNLDSNAIRWQGMVERYKMNWINVSEGSTLRESSIAKQFYVTDIPVYLVVDRSGMIVFNSSFSDDPAAEFEKAVANAAGR